MSAFICNPLHLRTLAAAACNACVYTGDIPACAAAPNRYALAHEIAGVLYLQNQQAVHERYPNDDLADLPGVAIPEPGELDVTERDLLRPHTLSPVAILKALQCYEYQACEAAGWIGSDAWKIVDRTRSHCIDRLAGYDEAAWELREEPAVV